MRHVVTDTRGPRVKFGAAVEVAGDNAVFGDGMEQGCGGEGLEEGRHVGG